MDGSCEGNSRKLHWFGLIQRVLTKKVLNESVEYQMTYGMKYLMSMEHIEQNALDLVGEYPEVPPCDLSGLLVACTQCQVPGFDPELCSAFGPEFDQKNNMAQPQIEHMQIFCTFHPLGHSKPPQVFSQQTASTASAVTNTSDASGLSNFTQVAARVVTQMITAPVAEVFGSTKIDSNCCFFFDLPCNSMRPVSIFCS